MTDDRIAQGHALIDKHFERAQRLDSHPAVRTLLPMMKACLHDLFAHIYAPSAAQAPSAETIAFELNPDNTALAGKLAAEETKNE